MEYVFYNPTTQCFLIDDERPLESNDLQQAMIGVGESVVKSILSDFPNYVVKVINRPLKEKPWHVELN